MAQRKGLHLILEIPIIYNLVQKIFGHKPAKIEWDRLIAEKTKGVVLDVGCGPGNQSQKFSLSKKYIGIDISEVYISDANRLYGHFGEFFVLSVLEIDKIPDEKFDLVILNGVLHHLSDIEVNVFFEKIKKKLSKNGVVVTLDPTYVVGRYVANFIVSLDRGLNIRRPSDLINLTEKYLPTLEKVIVKQSFPPYQRILCKFGNFS